MYLVSELLCRIVGVSVDFGGVIMVDFIKVFVKIKELFGWLEESDEFLEFQIQKFLIFLGGMNSVDSEVVFSVIFLFLIFADRLLGSVLEVLDGVFVVCFMEDKVYFFVINICKVFYVCCMKYVKEQLMRILNFCNWFCFY